MIPQTNKQLLSQDGAEVKVWNQTFNGSKANATYTISNPNVYAIPVIISAQAGSGDINTTMPPVEKSSAQYYGAGKQGNTIAITLNGSALITLAGGAGSKGGYQARKRTWHGGCENVFKTNWERANAWQTAQNGENASMIVTLKPKNNLVISFTYNSASNSKHLGNVSISALY